MSVMNCVNASYWRKLSSNDNFVQIQKGPLELESVVGCSLRKRTRRLKLPRVSFRRSGSELPVPDNLR